MCFELPSPTGHKRVEDGAELRWLRWVGWYATGF